MRIAEQKYCKLGAIIIRCIVVCTFYLYCTVFLQKPDDNPYWDQNTLVYLLSEWILLGSYSCHTSGWMVQFCGTDLTSRDHANTIHSTLRCMVALLNLYNGRVDHIGHLTELIFMNKCKAQNMDPLCKTIEVAGRSCLDHNKRGKW